MCWRRGTRHYPRFLEAPPPSPCLREDAAGGLLTLVERTRGLPPQRRLAAEAMVLCCRKAGQDALDRWVVMHLPDASPIDQASPHDVRGVRSVPRRGSTMLFTNPCVNASACTGCAPAAAACRASTAQRGASGVGRTRFCAERTGNDGEACTMRAWIGRVGSHCGRRNPRSRPAAHTCHWMTA